MEIRITFTSYLRFHGSISDSSNNHNRYVTMYNKNTNNLNCVKKTFEPSNTHKIHNNN